MPLRTCTTRTDKPFGPHCPGPLGPDQPSPGIPCVRDFAIEAGDLKDINTPELCAVTCIAKMGSTSPTGAIRITVGLETGYECYCGAADHFIPSNYKTDIGSCSTPCAGATCVKETGEGCCGGYWTINTVKVDCTGVPITPPAAGSNAPTWGWITIMSGSGFLVVAIIIGLIVNGVVLKRKSCSCQKDQRDMCIVPMFTMWIELPLLVIDGCKFVFTAGKIKPTRTRGEGLFCNNVTIASDETTWNPDYIEGGEEDEDEEAMVERAIAERAARDGQMLKGQGVSGGAYGTLNDI